MTSRPILPVIFLAALGSASLAEAKKPVIPAAPSKLEVIPLGVNAYKLNWKDNSDNETGWEVLISLAGGKPQHFQFIPTPNIKSYTIFTGEVTGFSLAFQVAAYTGVPGQEVPGDLSEIVKARPPSKSIFRAPTELVAKTLDDGRVRLSWTDNSTSEAGYQIQFRELKSKKWLTLGNVQTDQVYNLVGSGLAPSTDFEFRVRGYKLDGKISKFSNRAKATTRILGAPQQLVAIPGADGSFTFKWKDTSSTETGFELQQSVAGADFKPYWNFGAYNIAKRRLKATLKDFPLDKDVRYRIRAFHVAGDTKVFSDFSNLVASHSTPLTAPGSLAVTGSTENSLSVKWKDLSTRENGYRIDYRVVGTSAFSTKNAGGNSEAFTITGLEAGKNYEFRVRASDFFSGSLSPAPALVRGRTKEAITGDLNPVLALGVPFNYQIQLTSASGLKSLTVTGLPAGLSFDPATRRISGTLNVDGTYNLTVTATFNDGSVSTRTLKVSSIAPPVTVAAFDPASVTSGATIGVSMTGKFNDPDSASAARFVTTKGSFDIIFFPTAAPLTVDNFIDYMDAGEYDDMFFHRSVADFVVQGGGYQYNATDGFTEVTKFPAVTNEPGISNLRGTVAMAKLGGNPNSATSEWFVNIKDNSANLDNQNGGFTVFGRVPAAGMAVFDAINKLPLATYQFPFSPAKSLSDVPIDATTAPATLDPSTLVKITSAGPAPILSYSVTPLDPSIATATIVGTDVEISGVSEGSTSIRVTATDLDGQSVSQDIPVTVAIP